MKPERHKPIRKEKLKRKGKISRSQRRMHAVAQEQKLVISPQLHEAYSTKIEWAKKIIPKLKKEAEAPEKKEELG